LLSVLSGHSGPVESATFGPGRTVLTVSDDNTARIWGPFGDRSSAPGQPFIVFSGPVESAVFSPTSFFILTASRDNMARVQRGFVDEPSATFSGHSGPVRSAVFSPDGSRVLTASDDHTARIWDAASGKALATLSDHSDSVRSAVFSPDGSRVLTASDDHTARIWQDLLWEPRNKQLEVLDSGRELTLDERQKYLHE
jgi:WD40 repeat protein